MHPIRALYYREKDKKFGAVTGSAVRCSRPNDTNGVDWGKLPNGITCMSSTACYAKNPTAQDYANHWLSKDNHPGVPVYRLGGTVNLNDYPPGQFGNVDIGQSLAIYPSSAALASAFVNYELGTLPSGALTDIFIYGSLRGTIVDEANVQLNPDTFNFNMEGRGLRDAETWVQHETLGQGKPGTDFQTIFVGPTPIPGR